MSFILLVNILLSEEDCQALYKETFRNSCGREGPVVNLPNTYWHNFLNKHAIPKWSNFYFLCTHGGNIMSKITFLALIMLAWERFKDS